MQEKSITNIRKKGGLLKNIPPTLSKLLRQNPPLCLNYPPLCLTNNREKCDPKLYKLNYKSDKPFLIKACLLLAILELTPRQLKAERTLHRGQSPQSKISNRPCQRG